MANKFDRSLQKKLKAIQFAPKPEITKADPVKHRTRVNPKLIETKIQKRKAR